jgi:hypothetical protein
MNILKGFLVLICLTLSSYAGTRDPNVPDSKYINHGAGFNFVVKVAGVYEDDKMFCASAVLIDDYNFLTACHVIDKAKVCIITLDDGTKFNIKKIIMHSSYDGSVGIGDIALGHSDKPFGLKFYPKLYTDSDERGKLVNISGFGLPGTFSTGQVKESLDFKRRAGSNLIDGFEDDLIICSTSVRGRKGSTSLEFMISSGDSGGGLFIGNKLAGINSVVMGTKYNLSANSGYHNQSGHTRVSKFAEWIDEYKKKVE